MMLFLAFLACAAGGFAFGILTACLLLAAKEDELQIERARRCWRQMEGGW